MSDDAPVWLKIMEHGAAGEARTKAFLLDRFWVLERSVDIDGADYLIQLRSLAQRFTDRAPPVVGVVQAKYFQDRKTTHHIPSRYVLDGDGEPLKGFFAVLHLGREDDAAIHGVPDWAGKVEVRTAGAQFRVTDCAAQIIALRQGLGIAALPCFVGDADPLLVRVPGVDLHLHGTLWILTQGETRKTERVRLFTKFASHRLTAHAPLLAGLSMSRD